jgi:hypothetical protein
MGHVGLAAGHRNANWICCETARRDETIR